MATNATVLRREFNVNSVNLLAARFPQPDDYQAAKPARSPQKANRSMRPVNAMGPLAVHEPILRRPILQRQGNRMCGRMTMRTPPTQWCQQFLPQIDPSAFDLDFTARYNIAPTQPVTCVLPVSTAISGDSMWSVEMIRWGLVPPWSDELAIGSRMINARCETVAEKPSFRKPFVRQRCLVIADGYYEWLKTDDGKQPYLIESAGPPGSVITMAGLWETNTKAAPDGEPIRTCTIITTTANEQTDAVHDRMPVILDDSDYDAWLDPDFADPQALQSMLVPAASDRLKLMRVSRFVNNTRNEGAQCIEPMG